MPHLPVVIRFRDRFPAIALALSLFIIDSIVTMIGQPPYSQRITGHANEANIIFNWAMQNGWLTHIIITMCWISVIVISISVLPRIPSLGITFAWTLGHSFGALSWLVYDPKFHLGPWIIYPFCLSVGITCAIVAKHMLTNSKSIQA